MVRKSRIGHFSCCCYSRWPQGKSLPSSFLFFHSLLTFPNKKLHFLLTVSRYYSHLTRHHRIVYLPQHPSPTNSDSHSLQRIYLLPPAMPSSPPHPTSNSNPLIYAPVTLSTLSPEAARDLCATATTAWISHTAPDNKQHSHSQRHRYHSSNGSPTGRISLPMSPHEGLLPEGKSLLEV